MPLTRLFKSDNCQAFSTPADIAYTDTSIELETKRLVDEGTAFPSRRSLKEAVASLRAMPKPPTVDERDIIEMPDRARG
jgi:virulence-associated protein VagC